MIGLAARASVLVYQAPDTAAAVTDVMSQIVSDDGAKVISTSWGACEAGAGAANVTSENTLLQEAATQGQSFFAASGDSGSAACYQFDHTKTGLSVANPSSQPFAIAVGARLAANVRRHKVKRLTAVLLVKDQRDKSTVLIDGLKV